MARVLLARVVAPVGGYGQILMTQPMGAMYLAAVLRARGHAVRLLDQRARMHSPEAIADEAARFGADVVGIGGLTVEAGVMDAVARAARRRLPSARIVGGGPHASGYSGDMIRSGLYDAVVAGEGEVAFPQVVEAFAAGRDPSGIQGVATERTGHVAREEFGEYIEDLDSLPLPAYDLVDHAAYRGKLSVDLLWHHPNYHVLFGSRACPYRCTYCDTGTVFGKVFRAHSPERVLEEIALLYADYGVREIQFIEDIFNCDMERAKEICRRIAAWGRKIFLAYPIGLRADDMDEELLDLMWRAGARRLNYAIETASPRLQRVIEKNLDIQKALRIIRLSAEKGFLVKGYFTVGQPTETEEDVRLTVETARRSALHMAGFNRITPFKGTTMYKQVAHLLPPDLDFTKLDYDFSAINVSDTPTDRLVHLHGLAYRRFYLEPRRLWRLFRRIPNKRRALLWAAYMARKLFAEHTAEAAERLRPLHARFAAAGAGR